MYGKITAFTDPKTGTRYSITSNGEKSIFSAISNGTVVCKLEFRTREIPNLKGLFGEAWVAGKRSLKQD